jgi:predicted phosphate transport protein (TIGR00153 family)
MPITPFMKMFGKSPFKLLEKHMNVAHAAVNELRPFIAATKIEDWGLAEVLQLKIAAFENKADDVKKEIRAHLPKGLFLPVSRADILSLISAQDKIPNQAKDIVGLMLGRRMVFPHSMHDLFDHLIDRCVAACLQAKCVIDELDSLLESGFRGNEVSIVEKIIIELDRIEHETDELQIGLRRELFKLEPTLPPINVMFLYKIIEAVGGLADRAHDVGAQLQILLAR